MTDDFERRLQRDLGAIAAGVPAELTRSSAQGPASRWRPRLAAAAAALLILAVGAWVLTLDENESGPLDVGPSSTTVSGPTTTVATTTTVGAEEVAPPSETGTHRIWIANPDVAESGGVVVFAMIGPPEAAVYATVFGVDHWAGDRWEGIGGANSCAFPRCAAELVPGAEVLLVGPVGMSVGETGVGGAEALRTDGLDPGWYRIARGVGEDDIATGVFRVLPDSAMPLLPSAPEVLAGDESRWALNPTVVSTVGGRASIVVAGSPVDPEARVIRLVAERWSDGTWVGLFSLDVGLTAPVASLPPLPAGDYRLVADDGTGSAGRFWVSDVPGTPTACPTIPDMVHLLGADGERLGDPGPGARQGLYGSPSSIRVEWSAADGTVVTYRAAPAIVVDYAGQRVVADGPLRYSFGEGPAVESSRVEVRITLPECQGFATANFIVDGGSEEDNFALAKRLGEGFGARWGADFDASLLEACPTVPPPTPNSSNQSIFLWAYCRTDSEPDSVLAPVPLFVDPYQTLVTFERSLSEVHHGFENVIPVEMRGAAKHVELVDGLLTIDWGWDFDAAPLGARVDSAHNARRIVDQIAANAFQFDEIDAIDLGQLPLDVDRPFIYTRQQWEQTQSAD